MTLASPIWLAWNPRLYMSSASTRVASAGPPAVSTKMMSKKVSEPTIMSVDDVMIVYLSCGSVIEKNWRTRPAPSIVAASYMERGICRMAPWYRSEWNGMYCQDTMKTTAATARLPWPSQSCASSGQCSPAPSPKLGSSKALYMIEIAAELSNNGMKKNTASNAR